MIAEAPAAAPALTYRQTPKPIGYQLVLTLEGSRLTVDTTRKVHHVELGAVEQVRLTYDPRSFAQTAFRTTLRLKGGGTVTFTSMSWKSLVEAERQDAAYGAFARALIAAIGRANPAARFVAGKPRAIWIGLTIVAAITVVAMALFVWRAFATGATAAGVLGLLVGALGLWQLEPMVRLNKPRTFSPAAPPQDLLPAG